MSTCTLTVLSNNTARPGFSHEFGFSLHIQTPEGRSWLWDTGQSGVFMDNGALLGINFRALEGIALSHGHYDHVGGLKRFFTKYADFSGRVVSQAKAGTGRFAIRPGGKPRPIGPEGASTSWPPPGWEPVNNSLQLAPGLTFVTDVPRIPGRHQSVDGFFLDSHGVKKDVVPDDAFLLLQGEQGPVVILGCCHAGLANTLAQASAMARSDTIHQVIGGMHLMDAKDKVLEQSLAAFARHQVEIIRPCHCTGDDSMRWLERHFPGQTIEIMAGDRFTV